MTLLETQQTAVKLLGRACLNGFITAESFPENMGTPVTMFCQKQFWKRRFFQRTFETYTNPDGLIGGLLNRSGLSEIIKKKNRMGEIFLKAIGTP